MEVCGEKVLYKVTDTEGKVWAEWLHDYQAEVYLELGYTVEVMRDKKK